VNILLKHAEEILEIAVRGNEEIAIMIDRQGGVRMVDPAGWSLPSLRVEYGAAYVYKVERRAGMLRVEGWDGAQRCLLERRGGLRSALTGGSRPLAYLSGMTAILPVVPYHLMLAAPA
jgi:hypothetical protein